MPIKVACQCGASFAAKDELAGKAVRCPKCKQPLKIPAAAPAPAPAATSAMDDLFDEVGIEKKHGPTCPSCGAELKANAVMCIACGVNFETGEQARGHLLTTSAEGAAAATEELLGRAARQIQTDKDDDRKNKSSGAPAYVYIFGLVALAAFATMMFTLPKGKAFFITGAIIVSFGGLIQSYWGIRMIIAAFMESVAQGFLYLLVPFYPIFYWITRWKTVGGFFMNALKAMGLQALGGCFMGLGAVLPWTFEEKESWLPTSDAVEVVEVSYEYVPRELERSQPKLHG